MPLRAKRKRYPESRTCHGCGGKGWVPITNPGHWEETGAADGKVHRAWVKASTAPQRCIICMGEGLVLDENGSTSIITARGKVSQTI